MKILNLPEAYHFEIGRKDGVLTLEITDDDARRVLCEVVLYDPYLELPDGAVVSFSLLPVSSGHPEDVV